VLQLHNYCILIGCSTRLSAFLTAGSWEKSSRIFIPRQEEPPWEGLTAIRLSAGDALAAADVVGAARDGKDCTQEDALISTVNGMLLRVPISQVAKTSRYAKGHRVVKVKEGDEVSAVTAIQHQ